MNWEHAMFPDIFYSGLVMLYNEARKRYKIKEAEEKVEQNQKKIGLELYGFDR